MIGPDKGQLLILTRKRFGGFAAQVQNQHAGLDGPAIAGVLPDAFDEGQSPVGQSGFQRLLPRFVFRVAQLLRKRVPCGDERSAQGLALGLESIALEQEVECCGDLDQKLFHSSSGRPSAAMVLL